MPDGEERKPVSPLELPKFPELFTEDDKETLDWLKKLQKEQLIAAKGVFAPEEWEAKFPPERKVREMLGASWEWMPLTAQEAFLGRLPWTQVGLAPVQADRLRVMTNRQVADLELRQRQAEAVPLLIDNITRDAFAGVLTDSIALLRKRYPQLDPESNEYLNFEDKDRELFENYLGSLVGKTPKEMEELYKQARTPSIPSITSLEDITTIVPTIDPRFILSTVAFSKNMDEIQQALMQAYPPQELREPFNQQLQQDLEEELERLGFPPSGDMTKDTELLQEARVEQKKEKGIPITFEESLTGTTRSLLLREDNTLWYEDGLEQIGDYEPETGKIINPVQPFWFLDPEGEDLGEDVHLMPDGSLRHSDMPFNAPIGYLDPDTGEFKKSWQAHFFTGIEKPLGALERIFMPVTYFGIGVSYLVHYSRFAFERATKTPEQIMEKYEITEGELDEWFDLMGTASFEECKKFLPDGEYYKAYQKLSVWQRLLYEFPFWVGLGKGGISALRGIRAMEAAAAAGKIPKAMAVSGRIILEGTTLPTIERMSGVITHNVVGRATTAVFTSAQRRAALKTLEAQAVKQGVSIPKETQSALLKAYEAEYNKVLERELHGWLRARFGEVFPDWKKMSRTHFEEWFFMGTGKAIHRKLPDELYKYIMRHTSPEWAASRMMEMMGSAKITPELLQLTARETAKEAVKDISKALTEVISFGTAPPVPQSVVPIVEQTVAKVPVMLTSQMVSHLQRLGYSVDAIDKMTPEEASKIIKEVPVPPEVKMPPVPTATEREMVAMERELSSTRTELDILKQSDQHHLKRITDLEIAGDPTGQAKEHRENATSLRSEIDRLAVREKELEGQIEGLKAPPVAEAPIAPEVIPELVAMPAEVQADMLNRANSLLEQLPQVEASKIYSIPIPEGEVIIRTDSQGKTLVAAQIMLRDGQMVVSNIVAVKEKGLAIGRAMKEMLDYFQEHNFQLPPTAEMSPEAYRLVQRFTTTPAVPEAVTAPVTPVTPPTRVPGLTSQAIAAKIKTGERLDIQETQFYNQHQADIDKALGVKPVVNLQNKTPEDIVAGKHIDSEAKELSVQKATALQMGVREHEITPERAMATETPQEAASLLEQLSQWSDMDNPLHQALVLSAHADGDVGLLKQFLDDMPKKTDGITIDFSANIPPIAREAVIGKEPGDLDNVPEWLLYIQGIEDAAAAINSGWDMDWLRMKVVDVAAQAHKGYYAYAHKWVHAHHAIKEMIGYKRPAWFEFWARKEWNEDQFNLNEMVKTEDTVKSVEDLLTREDIANLLPKYPEDIRKVKLQYASWSRMVYDIMFSEQNSVRPLYGLEPIPYIEAYMKHMVERNVWSATFGKIRQFYDEVVKQGVIPDWARPRPPRPAHELAREGGIPDAIMEKDPEKLLMEYIDATAKSIYFTPVVLNNKAYADLLKEKGCPEPASWLDHWTLRWSGIPHPIVRGLDRTPLRFIRKPSSALKMALNNAVFAINPGWNFIVQPSSTALGNLTIGAKYNALGLQALYPANKEAKEIWEKAYTYIMKEYKSGAVAFQDIATKLSASFREGMTPIETARDVSFVLTHHIELNLQKASIYAGYLHGKSIGLEGAELVSYAAAHGAKVQSAYDRLWLPEIMANPYYSTTIGMFQTFCWTAFARAMENTSLKVFEPKIGAYRGIKVGTDEWKKTIDKRIRHLIEFLAAIFVINMVGEETIGRKPWTPSSFVPSSQILLSFILGRDRYNPRSLPLIGQFSSEVIRGVNVAVDDWMLTGNYDPLIQTFVRYLARGGVQAQRMWRAYKAIMEEGEVQDVSGKRLFDLEPEEYIKAMIFGIYSTESGKEYRQRMFEGLDMPVKTRIKELELVENRLGQEYKGEIIKYSDYRTRFREVMKDKEGNWKVQLDELDPILGYSELTVFLFRYELYREWYYEEVPEDQRLALRKRNPDVDAMMYFWGDVRSVRSIEAREKVLELFNQYDTGEIPLAHWSGDIGIVPIELELKS